MRNTARRVIPPRDALRKGAKSRAKKPAPSFPTASQLEQVTTRLQTLVRTGEAQKVDGAGKLLGQASFEDWEDFWSALKGFVRILNEKMIGKPFEIDAGGVLGDAESLLKALRQSEHFETLLYGDDQAVADACLKLAMPEVVG
jgi:hypothetical protein